MKYFGETKTHRVNMTENLAVSFSI